MVRESIDVINVLWIMTCTVFYTNKKWTCRKINVEYLINNFKANVHDLFSLTMITVFCRLKQMWVFSVLEEGLLFCSRPFYYTDTKVYAYIFFILFRYIKIIVYVAVNFAVLVKILSILLKIKHVKVGKIKVHVFMRKL